jgi:hypothetical protein
MYKIISIFLIVVFSISTSQACDFKNDIKKVDGGYIYSTSCHVLVGKKLEELDMRIKQVEELNKSIELKDLALRKSEERNLLWMDTAYKANERLNQYESARERNQWIHFALGVTTTALAVWGAGQLIKR